MVGYVLDLFLSQFARSGLSLIVRLRPICSSISSQLLLHFELSLPLEQSLRHKRKYKQKEVSQQGYINPEEVLVPQISSDASAGDAANRGACGEEQGIDSQLGN